MSIYSCSLFRQLQNEIKEKGLLSRVNYCVRLLLVFSRLNSRNCESCLFNSISVLSKLIQPETCCNSSRESNVLPAIYYVVQLLTAQTAENATYYELVPLEKILNYLMELVDGAVSKSSFSLWGLKILDSLVHFCKVSNYEPFEEKLKDFILLKWDLIASNLQSGFRIVSFDMIYIYMTKRLTSRIMHNIFGQFSGSSSVPFHSKRHYPFDPK